MNTGSITITDKSGTVMTFPVVTGTAPVAIQTIADAHDSRMTFSYDADGRLITVTDGIGRNTVLSYTNGLLTSVSAPGCPIVTYQYDGNNLVSIGYGDIDSSLKTEYTYSDGTSTLVSLRNYDGCEVIPSYEENLDGSLFVISEQAKKVISLENVNGTVKGARKLYSYGHMHTGIKSVTGTEDDSEGHTLYYHFNEAGNVISSNDELWHARCATYSSGIANTPSGEGRLMRTVVNRLPNVDFDSGWTQTKACSSDTYTWDVTVRCMSMPSAKIVKNGAGEFRQRTTANLFRSGNHTLSAYLKTSGLTGGEAFIRVRANGNVYESEKVSGLTGGYNNGSYAKGWRRLTVTFPFEYGTATGAGIELVCSAASGTLYWSCPQVEEGSLANHFNMTVNSDFSDMLIILQCTQRTVMEIYQRKLM